VQIGYTDLAKKARVDWRTVVRLVKRLLEKGYILVESMGDSTADGRIPTVYRVLSYGAILKAQREAGKLWVLKTGTGVFFARRWETVVSSSPSRVDSRSLTTVDSSSSPTVVSGAVSTVVSGAYHGVIGIKTLGREAGKETATSPSSSAIVATALRNGGVPIDDDAADKIVASCQKESADATGDEIAHFARIVIATHGKNPKINNLVGLLISAVAKYFRPPATELTRYRAGKKREREKQEQLARDILVDPQSTEAEREWARAVAAPPSR
jgi:hypothetical protein